MATGAAGHKQDLPPKGGYGPIEYARRLPRRGPSGYALFALGIGVAIYGYAKLFATNRRRREDWAEEIEVQVSLLPLHKAEQDRLILRQYRANLEEEAKIMEGVEGWVVGESVYQNEKWHTPPPVEILNLRPHEDMVRKVYGYNYNI
ncbi:PREDICTED: NADH dehydrogenase [ubiquinone] 1 alpha subcomplex subunit 13-like [Branchiostoma belcheri]|uniref:NADH dehydrogenase [ubiquinone] 1 alpha subcomplex subunit 13 n=1 Tax=Branchiostoma belcheri TaxID=7741 RepID=A0A6P4Y958_BRABE|nr:PREDICTED: NADH dehydrogenase [ubiquinone] 1 alpha subcomplex subunit 13-like [Branchiostoma belcheri]